MTPWRWWARRRRAGSDFGDMGTAFGLDAATSQMPLAPESHDAQRADAPAADSDRANRRSVW